MYPQSTCSGRNVASEPEAAVLKLYILEHNFRNASFTVWSSKHCPTKLYQAARYLWSTFENHPLDFISLYKLHRRLLTWQTHSLRNHNFVILDKEWQIGAGKTRLSYSTQSAKTLAKFIFCKCLEPHKILLKAFQTKSVFWYRRVMI